MITTARTLVLAFWAWVLEPDFPDMPWSNDRFDTEFTQMITLRHWRRVPLCQSADCRRRATRRMFLHDCLVPLGQTVWLYCARCIRKIKRSLRAGALIDCGPCGKSSSRLSDFATVVVL